MIRVLVLCYLWALTVPIFYAKVEQLERLPDDLQVDFDIYQEISDLRSTSARLIYWQILENYVSKFIEAKPAMPLDQQDFFRKHVARFMEPIVNYKSNSTRVKRQASDIRYRVEVRMLTIDQRRRYFTTVNLLKRDTRLQPNIYDVLADFHSGRENIRRAHNGPNFMSWHRLYLYLFESFLRLYDPTITIPYWASIFDDALGQRSTESVIWSNGFFGGGTGVISSGPFRDWGTINPDTVFRRDIGGSPLYTQGDIDIVLTKTRNRQLLFPTADPDSNAEIMHGKAHVYVSGSMNRLNEAVRDPLFYSHHCFVDYIWEQFRLKQRDDRIVSPEDDHPFDDLPMSVQNSTGHGRNEPMGFFPNGEIALDFLNSLGYSNIFFDIVQYASLPTCENSCGRSPYLTCENRACRSFTRQELGGGNYIDDLFNDSSPFVNTSLPQQPVTVTPLPQQPESACPKKTLLKEKDSIKIPESPSIRWAYIPVRIISKRSPSLPKFKDYSLYNYGASRARTRLSKSKQTLTQAGRQKGFGTCEKYESAVGKVKIITYGLNKKSLTEEIAIVDNRLGISHSTGFAVVRAPSPGNPSDAIVAAFDTCGRVCRPFCLKTTGSSGFAKFTGGIRVTSELPLQYGESYADATIASWDIPSGSESPEIDTGNVPLTFYCDYTDEWIWVGPDGPGTYPSIRSQNRSGSNFGVNTQTGGNWQNPRDPLTGRNSGVGINWLLNRNRIQNLLTLHGTHRDTQLGTQRDAQRDTQRDTQRGIHRGTQRGIQRGTQRGLQGDTQRGLQGDTQLGIQRDTHRDTQRGIHRDTQRGTGISRGGQFTDLNQYKGRQRPVMRWPRPGARRGSRERQLQRRTMQGCTVSRRCRLTVPCTGCFDLQVRYCIGSGQPAVCLNRRYVVHNMLTLF